MKQNETVKESKKPLLTRRKMILGTAALAAPVFAGGVVLPACASMGARPKGKTLARMQQSSLYQGDKFQNAESTEMMAPGSFWRTLSDWVSGEQIRSPREPLQVVRPDLSALIRAPRSGLRITWLGHNTALIQLQGIRVLTDPVFSGRISPVRGVGPKRFFEAPVPVADLPPVDVVLLSHDHYDHLDMPSIKALEPKTRCFVMPLGVGAHLRAWGVPEAKIVELGWWQSARPVSGLAVVATPARHFSGRALLDRNKTLWASFALVGRNHRVFFGGDTGYFGGLKHIGHRLGPFDFTLMPIGAYGPGWPLIHLNPEEAVQAHQDLQGRKMMPVHWGTFNLALHSWTEPAERLIKTAHKQGVDLALPRPGASITPDQQVQPRRWWPEVPWRPATAADLRRIQGES